MTETGARTVRTLRALVATLVVVGLGASAHAAGGSATLQPLAAAVLLLLVGPLVWCVGRSRTSVPRMVVATGAGQVVTHLALVAMAPSRGGSAAGAHVHGAVVTSGPGAAVPATLHLTAPMLLAHLLAAVLAAVLLTLGEDAVRAVARRFLTPVRAASIRPALGIRPSAPPVPRLRGRGVRPLGGRAPPLPAC